MLQNQPDFGGVSSIYVDHLRVPTRLDPLRARLIGQFTHGVIDTLASSLVRRGRGAVRPRARNFGLAAHALEPGEWTVRPRIVAITPVAEPAESHTRRSLEYRPEDFDPYAYWLPLDVGDPPAAHKIASAIGEIRGNRIVKRKGLFDPSLTAEVVYDATATHLKFKKYRPEEGTSGLKVVSSYRLAETVAAVSGRLVRRECELLGINPKFMPEVHFSGLRIERTQEGELHATPCEPAL